MLSEKKPTTGTSFVLLALTCATLLAACSDSLDALTSPETATLTFDAVDGSGFVGGHVTGVSMYPVVWQDYTLADGVVVNGQVTDESATPLAGVEVYFASATSPVPVDSATTDGSGNYSVELSAGVWVATLESGSPALGDLTTAPVVVAGPGPVAMDFQFPTAESVSGSVYEFLGPAISAAQVEFTGTQTGAVVTAICDGAGFFSTALVPDVYTAVVTPVGGPALTHLKQGFGSITVVGATVQDFSLQEGVQLSGVVLDDLGGPLLEGTGVEVLLAAGSEFFAPPSVVANALDGTYSIGPVPTGSVTLDLKPPGDTGFPRMQFLRSLAGTVQIEDFDMALGVILSGTLLEDDLSPAVGVDILAIPTDGSLPPVEVVTDVLGFYQTSVFPGSFDVTLSPDVLTAQLPEIQTLAVPGATTLDATLVLGALLTGAVTEPGTLIPAADVLVAIPGVLGASSVTDALGVYSFLSPIGTHTLEVLAQGGSLEDVALESIPGVLVPGPGTVVLDLALAFASAGPTIVQGLVTEPGGASAVGVVVTARSEVTGDVLGRALTVVGGYYLLVAD